MNKKNIYSFAILISALTLAGCANKEASIVKGDFGISLGQNAGNLEVKGYNEDLTELMVVPPAPSALFSSYNVGVSNTKVNRITAIGAVDSAEDCKIKKENILTDLRTQYRGIYLGSGKTDSYSGYIDFNNGKINVSCYNDLVIEYTLK